MMAEWGSPASVKRLNNQPIENFTLTAKVIMTLLMQ